MHVQRVEDLTDEGAAVAAGAEARAPRRRRRRRPAGAARIASRIAGSWTTASVCGVRRPSTAAAKSRSSWVTVAAAFDGPASAAALSDQGHDERLASSARRGYQGR